MKKDDSAGMDFSQDDLRQTGNPSISEVMSPCN